MPLHDERTSAAANSQDRHRLDEALRYLSPELKQTLALLHPETDEIAELTLGMLPLGTRVTLIALGAIYQEPVSDPDAPVIVSLTDFGRELITVAAEVEDDA